MSQPPIASNDRAPDILILGASARAAAASALRAGLRPAAVDLFADVDLQDIAPTRKIDQYPLEFIAAAATFDDCPFVYTGGLENHPNVVDRIARDRIVWGNTGEPLIRSRDPFLIDRLLREQNLPRPKLRSRDAPPAPDGVWLLKNFRSSAGQGVRSWDGTHSPRVDEYFQKRVDGVSVSAVYVASADQTRLCGLTRQLVGLLELNAPPFAWCGSHGPIQLPAPASDQVERTGTLIARQCGLRGLFGIDFIVDGETAIPVDVNPRYPASLEVLELAGGRSIFADHCRIFGAHLPELPNQRGQQTVAKAVLYAKQPLCFPSLTSVPGGDPEVGIPALADCPAAGTWIRPGEPICTLFAVGNDAHSCVAELTNRVQACRRKLDMPPQTSPTFQGVLEPLRFRG